MLTRGNESFRAPGENRTCDLPRVLPWQQHSRCHSVSFLMYISGAKFKEHCSNISGNILDSVFYYSSETIYDVITFLICIIQKHKYH